MESHSAGHVMTKRKGLVVPSLGVARPNYYKEVVGLRARTSCRGAKEKRGDQAGLRVMLWKLAQVSSPRFPGSCNVFAHSHRVLQAK
ncbi:hypothetical protein PSENEW3_00004527 [Picochlorum sp. SENEW3]|nr:hypothetical protein PSENEW3_00004527 [Picochlorum sp. SENEW3]